MGQGLRSRDHRAFRAVLVGLRKARGMTQDDLAGALGWDRSYLSRVETGERTCSVWEFMAICRALRESPSKVMRRIENW
mgnify:CR=1 FL=1